MMKHDDIYVLSLDFGTESVRGAIFSTKGQLVASRSHEYRTYYTKPGWAEQRPDEWWNAFLAVVTPLVQESGIYPEQIVSLAVDTTCCTLVALDAHFLPLRNAILWMDVRASEQAENIAQSGMEALKYNGYGNVSAAWMPPKALWLKEHEPELYANAYYLCDFQDWVNYRLTGRYTGSITAMTVRWYYDNRAGGWPGVFYEQIGLADIIEKIPQQVLPLGEPIATITRGVAALTGLSPETLVIQGGADAYVGMLGLGVCQPGTLAFITGSSHLLLGLTEQNFHTQGIFGTFPDAVIPGLAVAEGAQISTGSILKWFKDHFVRSDYESCAQQEGISVYRYLDRLAAKLPPGSEGLILLDYWQGNRNPLTDSKARGAIWGFSLKHTAVHMYRAIMEGIAYGTAHIMQYFANSGYKPTAVYAGGGATQSPVWIQIHSDVLGLPIHLTTEPNAPMLGDAILASYGAGVYSGLDEAVAEMVHIKRTIEPNLTNTEAYRYYVQQYINTYDHLKTLMHDMVSHEESLV